MLKNRSILILTFLSAEAVRARSETAVALEIDVQNLVIYRHDVFDATRLATQAGPVAPLPIRNFMYVTWIADVVAVNGTSAKGVAVAHGSFVALNPAPAAGTGIADTANSFPSAWTFDILRLDGSPVGSIMAGGWTLGSRAAGSLAPGQGNLAVLGGTGFYFGIRGEGKMNNTASRFASSTEDPANRRSLAGGGTARFTFQVVPHARPALTAVLHADFAPVTEASPARRGETLVAVATGLGPTLPGKLPGDSFPAGDFQEVAAPVQVLVNGNALNAVTRIGWPGTTGTYRVDFRVPDDTPAGIARLQLAAGWIAGPEIRIPLQ